MPVLVLFLVLKTYADLGTHMRKHRSPGEPVALIGFWWKTTKSTRK